MGLMRQLVPDVNAEPIKAKVGTLYTRVYLSPWSLQLDHNPVLTVPFILASLFRQQTAPIRPQGPRSAYPSGLQPVAHNDLNNGNGSASGSSGNRQIHRRVSRTDLDFEQALKQEGTVVLMEGLDVNSLGVEQSPNRSFASGSESVPATPQTQSQSQTQTQNQSQNRSITRVSLQPSTPTVLPPTPTPLRRLSSSTNSSSNNNNNNHLVTTTLHQLGPSSSSSSHDLGMMDVEEAERQTNRRTMYRSPGTSSSPDLATLLRKAKERGGAVLGGSGSGSSAQMRRGRDSSPPPPMPEHRNLHPASSSTLVASPNSEAGPADWVFTSPHRQKENGTLKVRCFYAVDALLGLLNSPFIFFLIHQASKVIGESQDKCAVGKDDGSKHC